VQASAEDLPHEFDGLASQVHVQFPWGSLLRGVAAGDASVMLNLRRICLPEANLLITIGVDPERDLAEWKRLELPPVSVDYVISVLSGKYETAGFKIVGARELSSSELPGFQTSWAKRLQRNSSRRFITIDAAAMKLIPKLGVSQNRER
jgi:16S rRNA (adenine(1408)-N(1))-methyltransferase